MIRPSLETTSANTRVLETDGKPGPPAAGMTLRVNLKRGNPCKNTSAGARIPPNVSDELKNQWGWGGFTTQDRLRCQVGLL